MGERDSDFSAFVAGRWTSLYRTAYLLTGEHAAAEDLLQAALVKCYVAWPRIRQQSVEAYVRKTMVNQLISWRRRVATKAEMLTDEIRNRASPGDAVAEADQRTMLRGTLAELPPRQRAVLVLRFYEDLDVAETAELMGTSTGTVKSQTSDALRRLRRLLGDEGFTDSLDVISTRETDGSPA